MAQNDTSADTWDADPSVNLSISLYCVLCVKHHPGCYQCYICNQFICKKCQRFRGDKIKKKNIKRIDLIFGMKHRSLICKLCDLYKLCENTSIYTISYCVYCDSIYPYRDGCYLICKKCMLENKANGLIESRKRLPHKKAKLIIELQFIPELVQLIFDYYYYPRRYLLGEY